ncbi:MAG: helix-turn-helix transcriptional regulator [Bacteroidia bacterium]
MTDKERELKEKLKLQKKFGEHLTKLRKAKGLSAAGLARACEMERSSIARLEMGRINPSLFILKKLASSLDIELKDLFNDFK